MNAILNLALIATLFLGSCNRHSNFKSDGELKSLLCHSWIVPSNFELLEDSLNKVDIIPPAEGQMVVQFNTDGTFKIDFKKGQWLYNRKSRELILTAGNIKHRYQILKLTETELTVEKVNAVKKTTISMWRA